MKPPVKPANPFAVLASLRESLPEAPVENTAERPAKVTPAGPFVGNIHTLAPRIVLSISRKGRGGRTVSVISGLQGSEAVLDDLCRELKKALGCGASVESGTIVVSGSILDRLESWLTTKGAKRIVIGT